MKRLTLALLSLLMVYSTSFGQSKGQCYQLKKAHVEYQISGSMQSGSEQLYFDNWGIREAKYTSLKINVAGFSTENKTATFIEGYWIYAVDLITNTGTKQENTILKDLKDEDLTDLGKETMIRMGGKKIGTETILGKPCDIWDIPGIGSKTWVWNWIPLKTEVNMAGMKVTYTATKISETFDVQKLDRPTNIEYREMGDVMDVLKKIKGK